jgi:hypothetical protein
MIHPLPRLTLLLALLLGLLLAGCPLPQAVPSYPTTGKIAPPRIQADAASPAETIIDVSPSCPGGDPAFTLAASLVDENTLEAVEARWFVDYQPSSQARRTIYGGPEIINAPSDGITTVRSIAPFTFHPSGFDPSEPAGADQAFRDAGGLHVVELVVSNGFEPVSNTGVALPNRTPQHNFETQVFRWAFHYAPGGLCAPP